MQVSFVVRRGELCTRRKDVKIGGGCGNTISISSNREEVSESWPAWTASGGVTRLESSGESGGGEGDICGIVGVRPRPKSIQRRRDF
jgi:hypothetical protein